MRARDVWQRVVDYTAYLVVRLIVAVIQVMPLDMGRCFSEVAAWFAGDVLRLRHRTITSNFDLVMPELAASPRRELSRRMWHHLMLMVCEVAWAQRRLHRCNWPQYVRLVDNQSLLRATIARRPAVMVTGHFGNFEIGGYLVGLMGVRSTTIARRLDNPFLHRWVERFRGARGQDMVDKVGCAPIIDEHLRKAGVLSLLADQYAGDKGAWVNFCGVPASCHKALALFTMTSDAPMLAVYTRRIEGRPMQFESGCLAAIDPLADPEGTCQSVESLTRWYNRQLERIIDLAPEQYWWLHRRWRPPPQRIRDKLGR